LSEIRDASDDPNYWDEVMQVGLLIDCRWGNQFGEGNPKTHVTVTVMLLGIQVNLLGWFLKDDLGLGTWEKIKNGCECLGDPDCWRFLAVLHCLHRFLTPKKPPQS